MRQEVHVMGTYAQKMGRIFNALGLLPGEDLNEAKASDLMTGDVLWNSLGGVFFIDEAYQIG
jgi:hypothetical protein